jgi:peroxiredoxin
MHRFCLALAALFFSTAIFSQQQPTTVTANQGIFVITESGRRPAQIQQQFPYDISLRTAASDTLLSSQAFEKNGKPTVLMFWLTTCAPCKMELKAITAKYAQWKQEKDFNLYAISIDFPRNAEQFVKRVTEANWPFPAFHDFNREFQAVMPGNLNGLPQTFVLDKDGNIVYHSRKFIPGDEDKLFEAIQKL